MTALSDKNAHFSGLERKAIVFLAVAALILLAVFAAALVRQGYFTQTSRLYVIANSALGISKGMAVQLSGFRIGSVEDLTLEADTRVRLQLVVQSELLRHIPQDSQARLAKEGFIGARFIEILPGSKNARPIAANGVLAFERDRDLTALAAELTGKIQPILEDIHRFTSSVNEPDGDIRQTLRHIRETTATVAALRTDLRQLVSNSGERMNEVAGKLELVLDRTAGTLDKAGRAIDSLGNTLATVNRELPNMVLKIDQSLKNVEAVTVDARRVSAAMSEQLPGAMQDGRILVEDTREIIDGAKRAWPIRNLIAAPVETAPALDSYDAGKKKP